MKISSVLRTALAGAFTNLNNCHIYSGSIPATGDTSPTGTLLLSFTTAGIAWNAPASNALGIAGAPITSDAAVAGGTAGYAMFTDGAGQVMYCTVGTSAAEVILSTLTIASGGTLNMLSLSITMPGS